MVGEWETSVPPFATCKRTGSLANMHMGSVASRSMGMLPAVPISASKFPPFTFRGLNQSSLEPSVAPFTSALQSLAAVNTASRCWCFKPRCGLFCLMLQMCRDSPVAAAKATASLKIVPLPLFWLPSISNNWTSPKQYVIEFGFEWRLQIINKRLKYFRI